MLSIKSFTGKVLFTFETKSIKVALEAAVAAGANLVGANLVGANLVGANLVGANLDGATLVGANLDGATLRAASLIGASLRGASLVGASLVGANLVGANLVGANLDGATLRGASLAGASLRGTTRLPDYSLVSEKGSAFTGWKKLQGGYIAKLGIPEDAERVSTPIGRKCRASKVIVFDIFDSEGNKAPEGFVGHSLHRNAFTYQAGAVVECPNYDRDLRVECTGGIHFFITRKEAEAY